MTGIGPFTGKLSWLDEFPSSKLTLSYGKSPCLMGKSTIYKWSFSLANG
jgi:hypothetical protein